MRRVFSHSLPAMSFEALMSTVMPSASPTHFATSLTNSFFLSFAEIFDFHGRSSREQNFVSLLTLSTMSCTNLNGGRSRS